MAETIGPWQGNFPTRGPRRHRRILGLVIPCQVASPQSLTPFHQANPVYPVAAGKNKQVIPNEEEVEV